MPSFLRRWKSLAIPRQQDLPFRDFAVVAAIIICLKLMLFDLLAGGALATRMCQWDCAWYVSIVTSGYDATTHPVGGIQQANWAFFPLYPILVSIPVAFLRIDPKIAGILVSSACLFVFTVVGAQYRRLTRPGSSYYAWLKLVAAWPYSFYFQSAYSEALYAALAMAAMLVLVGNRPYAASGLIALLTATRPTGLILAIGLSFRQATLLRLSIGPAKSLVILLPIAICLTGLISFMVFLYHRTGDAFAFAAIQKAWGHHPDNPVTVLWSGLADFSITPLHLGKSYESAWALIGLFTAGWLAVRRRFMEAWFCGATVVMALSTGVVGSMPRFIATNPVLLLVVADLYEMLAERRLRLIVISTLLAVQLGFVIEWFRAAHFLT